MNNNDSHPLDIFSNFSLRDLFLTVKTSILTRSNSTLFWNGLFYFVFFTTLIISPDWAGLISGLGSIAYLIILFFSTDSEKEKLEDQLWVAVTFTFWIFISMMIILGLGYLLLVKPITKFNKWLNSKRSN